MHDFVGHLLSSKLIHIVRCLFVSSLLSRFLLPLLISKNTLSHPHIHTYIHTYIQTYHYHQKKRVPGEIRPRNSVHALNDTHTRIWCRVIHLVSLNRKAVDLYRQGTAPLAVSDTFVYCISSPTCYVYSPLAAPRYSTTVIHT